MRQQRRVAVAVVAMHTNFYIYLQSSDRCGPLRYVVFLFWFVVVAQNLLLGVGDSIEGEPTPFPLQCWTLLYVMILAVVSSWVTGIYDRRKSYTVRAKIGTMKRLPYFP